MKNILWSRKVTESHSTKALLPFGQFLVCNKQTFYFNSWALIVTQDGPERKELCFRLASFRSSLRRSCGPSISQRTSIHAQNTWWDKAEEGQGPRASGQRHAHSQKSHSVCNVGRWVGEVGSNTVIRYREVSDSWHLVMIAAKNRRGHLISAGDKWELPGWLCIGMELWPLVVLTVPAAWQCLSSSDDPEAEEPHLLAPISSLSLRKGWTRQVTIIKTAVSLYWALARWRAFYEMVKCITSLSPFNSPINLALLIPF